MEAGAEPAVIRRDALAWGLHRRVRMRVLTIVATGLILCSSAMAASQKPARAEVTSGAGATTSSHVATALLRPKSAVATPPQRSTRPRAFRAFNSPWELGDAQVRSGGMIVWSR